MTRVTRIPASLHKEKIIAPIPQEFWTIEFEIRQVCDADLARVALPVKHESFLGDSNMRLLKTALLGSAAAIVATGAAQAADLPVKKAAAAVQYVETCPVYGAGFYKLPGTDICIRHFGSMKFNFAFQNERNAIFWPPDPNSDPSPAQAGASNTIGWQWTIRPGWDFRSPTEYGTLRTVVQMRVDQRNGVHENDDPVLTGVMRTSNLIHRGYIEWAGFIIGRTSSQFIYWDQDDVITAIGGDPKTTATQFTYVFAAPGGFKATIGLEDSSAWTSGGGSFVDLTTTTPAGFPSVGPNRRYDIIGSLSTEQAWGSAKVSGAAHFTQTNNDTDPLGPNGIPDETKTGTGWAALAGITFNLPWLGPKDQLLLEATYSNGAVAYSGINGGAENDFVSFERRGQYLDGLQNTSTVSDTFLVDNGNAGDYDIKKNKAWSVAGQLRHYWSPLWRSNLMASYHAVDMPSQACNGPNRTVAQGGAGQGWCDPKAWDVAANLIWGRSRKTAEIGVEAAYKSTSVDASPAMQRFADRNGYDVSPSGWVVSLFIQRSW